MSRRKTKRCADCETPISPTATRCRKCATRARWADDEYRRRQAAAVKAKWQDPEYRRKEAEAP